MKCLELGDCIIAIHCVEYVKSFVSAYYFYAKTLVNLLNFKCIKWPLTREPTIVFLFEIATQTDLIKRNEKFRKSKQMHFHIL